MEENLPDTGGIGQDVLSLIDQLEQLLADSRRIPLSGRALVDEELAAGLIEGIRARLPEELRESRWLLMERDRLLSEARLQAQRVVEEARTRVASLADDSAVAREAQVQAQDVVDKARQVAREIRHGALEYADSTLADTETALEQALENVRAGRAELKVSNR